MQQQTQQAAVAADKITKGRGPNPMPAGVDAPTKKAVSDNWVGRSAGRVCKTCIHFAPKAGSIGRCRRNAPTMSGFPVVYTTDWCGEHKLNEEAL